MMESVRRELAAEHERRVRAEEESRLIRYLSPFERFLLFCYARVARLAHIPRPRFLVCGGPLFWCLVVPGLWFRWAYGVSPLALVAPGEDPHADPWFADARRPATDVLRRRGPPTRKLPVLMLPGMTRAARVRPPRPRGAALSGDRRASRARGARPRRARPPRRSTALEVWQGVGCFAGSHRRRLWSSPSMLSQFVLRPACLQRHLALNGTTWDDPADIKVRASSGLGAADAFGPLNLWGELMANLAILGYDETSLRLLGFDWRLSAQRLEARDGFFTQVKAEVELLGALSGAKVAVLAHSLGANHFVHFMRWVEAREPGWVERRVARFAPICGALLGSAKALAYLVTGEMTDAVGMGPLLAQLFESHGGIQRRAVADLTRSWASVPALLPKGGDAFWRTDDFVVLDEPPADVRAALERDAAANGTVAAALLAALATNRTMAVDAALDWLRAMLPAYGALLDGEYDLTGPPAAGRRRRRPPLPARAWGNGLLAPLPKAPSLEIYCLYGTGRSTPKTFEFAWTRPPRAAPAFDDARPPRPPRLPSFRPPRDADVPRQVPERYLVISDAGAPGSGVIAGDGDGTVPILSLGYLCASGYGTKARNPARVRVRTKEYAHEHTTTYDALRSPLDTISGLANDKDSDHITSAAPRPPFANAFLSRHRFAIVFLARGARSPRQPRDDLRRHRRRRVRGGALRGARRVRHLRPRRGAPRRAPGGARPRRRRAHGVPGQRERAEAVVYVPARHRRPEAAHGPRADAAGPAARTLDGILPLAEHVERAADGVAALRPRLEPRLLDDAEARGRGDARDVGVVVGVPLLALEHPGVVALGQRLHGEDEVAARREARREARDDGFEVAKVAEHVGGHDEVEGALREAVDGREVQ